MATMPTAPARKPSLKYWLLVVALLAAGVLTIFSIGLYFWVLALALIVMSPFRAKPRIFRSGIALFLGFLFGAALVAPWGCTQSVSASSTMGEEVVSPVVCTSPLGIEYSGADPFEPSPLPAILVGAGLGVMAFTGTWFLTPDLATNPTSAQTHNG
ncbi:MAG: hypothetical protein WBM90_12050 [Acidimicrobiia bacterium]